jgi:hypothetical protein
LESVSKTLRSTNWHGTFLLVLTSGKHNLKMARHKSGSNTRVFQNFSRTSWMFIISRIHHEQIGTKVDKWHMVLFVFSRTSIIYWWNLLIPTVQNGSIQNRFYIKTSIHDFSANIQWKRTIQTLGYSAMIILSNPYLNWRNYGVWFPTLIWVHWWIWWVQALKSKNRCALRCD